MEFSERVFCGHLTPDHTGRGVLLAGWVDAFRDHGGLLFIHLRDRSGIIQIVFSPEAASADVYRQAASLRAEYCVAVQGEVRKRLPGTENPNIETGDIEVFVSELTVLSESEALPFAISDKAMVAGASSAGTDHVNEDLRMQYRYLDIRRPAMQKNLILRHRISQCVREFLDSRSFVEVETPVLTMSTPEGARDYLVPSRIHPRSFYALPQSPQLFKQLLMIGAWSATFSLPGVSAMKTCARTASGIHQLDIEASFIDEEFPL